MDRTESTDLPPVVPHSAPRRGTSDFEAELSTHLRKRLRMGFAALGVVVAAMWVVPRVLHLAFAGSIGRIGAFEIVHLVSVLAIAHLVYRLRRDNWTYPSIVRTDSMGLVAGIAVTLVLAALSSWEIFPFVFCVLNLLIIVRAVVVPSSGRRTLVLSLLSVPGLAAVFLLNRTLPLDPEIVPASGHRLAYAGLYLAVLLLAVGVAAFASRVAFSLRRQVFDAKRIGQYVLEARIGAGAMGEVYRATHALLKRPTALKLLRPEITGLEAIVRFEREVQQTSRLTHPNTIAIFDYGHTAGGIFYYAMELLDGANLQQILARTGPMPASRVIHVLSQVCGSLAEAHGLGLVHRDVKPANIFLCVRGGVPDVVKVLDFGLVKEIHSDDPGLTRAGYFLGTPETAAPEMFTGQAGPNADLYSVGVVGYRLLAGRPPFEAEDLGELIRHHLQTRPERPSLYRPGAPPDIEDVLLGCLAKNPEDRPRSAGELRRQLEACADAGKWTEDDAGAWWEANAPNLGAGTTTEA